MVARGTDVEETLDPKAQQKKVEYYLDQPLRLKRSAYGQPMETLQPAAASGRRFVRQCRGHMWGKGSARTTGFEALPDQRRALCAAIARPRSAYL